MDPTTSRVTVVQRLTNETDLFMNHGDVQDELQLCPVV